MRISFILGLAISVLSWFAVEALAVLTVCAPTLASTVAMEVDGDFKKGKKYYENGAYDEAFACFINSSRSSSARISGPANFWLYKCYFNGKGAKANTAIAMRHLKLAAQAHCVPACLELAKYYETTEFPPIGNFEGRFRGETNLDGLPRDGQVYYDTRANGAKFWSGEDTRKAISAEWYAIAAEETLNNGDGNNSLKLEDFHRALEYYNKAISIYPWTSKERATMEQGLQRTLRGERVWREGINNYRFCDLQEMGDSRLAEGSTISVIGIVEPRSSDGTGFFMKVKDTDKGGFAEIYIQLDTVKCKPRLGTQMVRGRYRPAVSQYGLPVTIYEVETVSDMTPEGRGEIWYDASEVQKS